MLFCDRDLAARVEAAECELLAAACANIARRLDEVFVLSIAGGRAGFTTPGSPLNKVAGLGFAGSLDESEWRPLEEAYMAHGAPVQVELSTLADPSIAHWLTCRGYRLVGVENVLGCSLSAGGKLAGPADIEVAATSIEELESWLDVIVTGFAVPDVQGVPSHESFDRTVLENIMRDFGQADGVVRYLARRGGQTVGAGTMRVHGGVAQLCGAATLPAHRRQGVQTAVLAHRLAEAGRLGATIAVVTTQPGSKSQENTQKQGFELLYSRNVLLREA